MCRGVGGGKERLVGRGVGEWGSVLACGERNGGGVGKCVRVWDPYTFPHISSLTSFLSPFPTSPLPPPHPNTLFYTSHTSSHISPHTFFLLSHISPHFLQSVAKLPCDKVSVAKLPCGEVTGNRLFDEIIQSWARLRYYVGVSWLSS